MPLSLGKVLDPEIFEVMSPPPLEADRGIFIKSASGKIALTFVGPISQASKVDGRREGWPAGVPSVKRS